MKKGIFIILIISFINTLYSQQRSSIGIDFGYMSSDNSKLNLLLLLSEFDYISYNILKNSNDSIIEKYSITPNIGISYKSKSYFNDKLYIDLSMKYHILKKQSKEITYFKNGNYTAVNVSSPSNVDYNSFLQEYDYSFKLNLYTLSIVPYYKLYTRDKFYISTGLGIAYSICILRQKGIHASYTDTAITINKANIKTSSYKFGIISSLQLCYNLTKKISLDYCFLYSFQGKIDTYKQSFYNTETGIIKEEYRVPLVNSYRGIPKFNLSGYYQRIGIFYNF